MATSDQCISSSTCTSVQSDPVLHCPHFNASSADSFLKKLCGKEKLFIMINISFLQQCFQLYSIIVFSFIKSFHISTTFFQSRTCLLHVFCLLENCLKNGFPVTLFHLCQCLLELLVIDGPNFDESKLFIWGE